MATATVVPMNKAERAEHLCTEVKTLAGELGELHKKLENAQRRVTALESQRTELAEAAASGKPAKPSASADVHAALDEARLPVEALTKTIREKQAAHDRLSNELGQLNREISHEAEKAATELKFQTLKAANDAAAVHLNAKLREAIVSLIEYQAAADALIATGHVHAVAAAMGGAKKVWYANKRPVAEVELMRSEGYTMRGDSVLELRTLWDPPRNRPRQ